MKKVPLFILAAASIAGLCGVSCTTPEQQEQQRVQQEKWHQCKQNMQSGDKIVRSERGGTMIIHNGDNYYRLNSDGRRTPVKKVRY